MRGVCDRITYNARLLWDSSEKRELFNYLYALSNEHLLDVFDRDDIYVEIIRRERGRIYSLNAYMLAGEFYGEMANYSTSDIKMLRRLSM